MFKQLFRPSKVSEPVPESILLSADTDPYIALQLWLNLKPEFADSLAQADWLNQFAHKLFEKQQRLKYEYFSKTDDSVDAKILDEPYPLKLMHSKIRDELEAYRQEYQHHQYFSGYLYQGYENLGLMGARDTEKRYRDMDIMHFINSDSHLLDLGCNCGFMGIHASYRTGCKVDGFDWNPYMINVGNHVAEYLGIQDRVKLFVDDFNTFSPKQLYDVIFTFASYKTTDKGINNTIYEHLEKLHTWLNPGGLVVFESHHLGWEPRNPLSTDDLAGLERLYKWEGSKLIENNTREVFIFYKL